MIRTFKKYTNHIYRDLPAQYIYASRSAGACILRFWIFPETR